MSFDHLAPLIRTLLYEGVSLYPYRASALKNRERLLLGTLAPRAFAEAVGERWRLRAEVLVRGEGDAQVRLEARGLFEDEVRVALEEHTVAALVRDGCIATQDAIEVRVTAASLERRLHRISIEVRNVAIVEPDARPTRETRASMARISLGAAHVLVSVSGAELVSSIDPPADLVGMVVNEGCFTVLVGSRDRSDTMLASPIALGDYPRIAPESAGDFFDATEIDEMLALRVLTLSDAEKAEIRSGDRRGREILERTEAMSAEMLSSLHGRLARAPTVIELNGRSLTAGDQVRLRPTRRADAMDIALVDRVATIASIEQELDGDLLIAVTVDDDPGADLGRRGWPGHRFFFRPDEVEPLR